jgi:hypothetical protein
MSSATHASVGGLIPALADVHRGVNSIPRLFFIVPAVKANALRHPREYFRGRTTTKYYLYFLCVHTKCPVEAASIKIKVNKSWVVKVAPLLAVSLRILQLSLGALGMHLNLEDVRFELTTSAIGRMREVVSSILSEEGGYGDLLQQLSLCDDPLLVTETTSQFKLPELCGDAYNLIQEQATEQRAWRMHMELVYKKGNPQTFWVCKEIADNQSIGYVKMY